jgi:hypothetical protein
VQEARVGDRHGVDGPFDFFLPESKEGLESRKFREEIVALPDEVLKDLEMVWHAVDDLGGGETETFMGRSPGSQSSHVVASDGDNHRKSAVFAATGKSVERISTRSQ